MPLSHFHFAMMAFTGYPVRKCWGPVVRGVCILTLKNLPEVYSLGVNADYRTNLFFNKYYHSEDHVVMNCMEERLLNQNHLEFTQDCKVP